MSLKKITAKKRGRPVKREQPQRKKIKAYVREEWRTNPNTSRTKLCKDVKDIFGVSINPKAITKMTKGIGKPPRPIKEYKPKQFKEGMSKGKTFKMLRQDKFEMVFGVKEITEANVDGVIKTLKSLDSRSRANVRKQLVGSEYRQALKDKDTKKIALYDKVFASISTDSTAWTNRSGKKSLYENTNVSQTRVK